jgi:hypothetical protein
MLKWLAAIVVSLALYPLASVSLRTHIVSVIVQYTALLIWAYALHRVLRAYSINSEARETFRLYTNAVAALAPFLTLIVLPNLHRALHLASLRDAWLLTQTIDDGPVAALIAVLHPIVVLVALFVPARIPVAVAERYRADLRRTICAVAFALGIVLPVILAALIGVILAAVH